MHTTSETFADDRSTSEWLDAAGRDLLFTGARTANSFAETPVTDSELLQVWNLAKWAPTATNTQPLRVLYIRKPEARGRLIMHLASANQVKTESAPVVAILAKDTRFHEYMTALVPFKPQLADTFAADTEMRARVATFNATLQAGYFILAVRACGLAAGPMAGFDPIGVDTEFFADGRYKSILVVNIGHPGERPWFERLPRLSPDQAVQWA